MGMKMKVDAIQTPDGKWVGTWAEGIYIFSLLDETSDEISGTLTLSDGRKVVAKPIRYFDTRGEAILAVNDYLDKNQYTPVV